MTSNLFNLSGRRALVTGSSRGIGQAIALGLAEHGAAVAFHYVSREDEASKAARQAEEFGVRTTVVGGDVSQEGASRRMAEQAADQLGGPLDIVIANAAVEIRQPWDETAWSSGRQQFDANMLGTLELLQATIPSMVERKWGRVVTIGSVQQVRPHPQLVVYAALKSALVNMVRNLALQLSRTGVTVNNIAPGAILTDRNAAVLSDPKYHEWAVERIPMGFVGEPVDCSGAVVLLCSEAGRYMTGVDLLVDGGMHLG
ncbi:short-chain dehydrogenase (plasmid) [Microvirga ossetica]|uniref:Short-chain dehydrogenase n=1 Tax=Microvirga ossetica TaxID=1882682 RepID=A0A1B2EVU2_9HYPH|nr:SDR family oxidoreductase [Microvirga ossetica]ANY84063.1 short-chain dehydrogenase [Microvirga ossetica]